MRKHTSAYIFSIGLMVLTVWCGTADSTMAQSSGRSAPSLQELRIRVLDKSNLGVRVQINLGINELKQVSAYTDWSGNAIFHRLAPATYTLVISAAGEELYRNQLTLKNGDGFRSEVVHLDNVTFTDRTGVVSLNDLRVPQETYRQYLAGIEAIRAGNLEKSMQLLDNALKLYPAHAKSHNARGVIFHMTQRNKEAEDAFRHAIQFDADSLEPRLNLGNLLLESMRPFEARTELQKAIEVDAESVTAIELLLESMLVTHDEVSAVSLARSLHRRSTKHPARLHFEIASALTDHGMVDLAVEQYSLVLQDGPSFSERREAETVLLQRRNQENHERDKLQ